MYLRGCFSTGTPVSFTNKTDLHDITETLLKVTLNTIGKTNKQTNKQTKTSDKKLRNETGEPGENHRPVASHRQTLSHNVVDLILIEIRTHNIRGKGTDCIGSCKSIFTVFHSECASYC
jgi:hypothetical protein